MKENSLDRAAFLSKCKEVAWYWKDKMPMLAMEEAGELIQAISKFERELENGSIASIEKAGRNLIAEIGDMYISLMALQIHHEKFIDVDDIDNYIEKKVAKEYD